MGKGVSFLPSDFFFALYFLFLSAFLFISLNLTASCDVFIKYPIKCLTKTKPNDFFSHYLFFLFKVVICGQQFPGLVIFCIDFNFADKIFELFWMLSKESRMFIKLRYANNRFCLKSLSFLFFIIWSLIRQTFKLNFLFIFQHFVKIFMATSLSKETYGFQNCQPQEYKILLTARVKNADFNENQKLSFNIF